MQVLFVITLTLLGCQGVRSGAVPQASPDGPASDRPELGRLTAAVIAGDIARVDRLLELGADMNENLGTPTEAITPILVAISAGNPVMAHSLALRGAMAWPGNRGYSAIDYALFVGMDSVATTLGETHSSGQKTPSLGLP